MSEAMSCEREEDAEPRLERDVGYAEEAAVAPSSSRRIFAMTETTDEELNRIRRERDNDPCRTEQLMRRGHLLIRFAREGLLRDIDQIVRRCPREEMLAWFTVRMFKEACLHNHLHAITYMVDNGLDVGFHAVAEAVHWLVDGCDEERDGMDVVPALDFLVTDAGMPPDVQRETDFRTPLHVAVQRGLFEAARRLIELGADINAVAKDDAMPLTLAEKSVKPDGLSTPATMPTASNTVSSRGTATASKAEVLSNKSHLLVRDDGTEEEGAEEEERDEKNNLLDAQREQGEEKVTSVGVGDGGCLGSSSSWLRVTAGRARICGLLVERGARRTWRRAPSEQQTALDKKYAVLLEGDDDRNLCTFSG